jgi:hypothetical protein
MLDRTQTTCAILKKMYKRLMKKRKSRCRNQCDAYINNVLIKGPSFSSPFETGTMSQTTERAWRRSGRSRRFQQPLSSRKCNLTRPKQTRQLVGTTQSAIVPSSYTKYSPVLVIAASRHQDRLCRSRSVGRLERGRSFAKTCSRRDQRPRDHVAVG